MKKMFVKCCFATLMLSPMSLYAQAKINGKVFTKSEDKITNASVLVHPDEKKVDVNPDGSFVLENLTPGAKEIIVSAPNFDDESQRFVWNSNDTTVIFQLSLKSKKMEDVTVKTTRADDKSPTSFTNLDKNQLQKNNFGQDLPTLLEATPSAVTTSDAGTGIGYTGIRLRGTDPSRTNVTINGIPVNDAESYDVYWVNMPDLTSSTENIQIQRGVGSSTNGAAAFGASINIKTDDIRQKSYMSLDNSGGSFGTIRNTIKAGTGLINSHYSMDVRLSNILSDGYIDRASSNLKSYFISGAYVGEKSILRANIFSGHEQTYQSWYGTPESKLFGDATAQNAYADRNYLSDAERANLLNSGRTYNYYTYKNQEDNYKQSHYQLYLTHTISPKTVFNIAAHYTRGQGYYEEYKTDDKLSKYGLEEVKIGNDTIKTSDIIRRRWLDNHFYGTVYSIANDTKTGLKLTFGGAANVYEGDHFGEVIWAKFASNGKLGNRYYSDYANKSEVNNYLKASYDIKKLSLFADAQYRVIQYKYVEAASSSMQTANFSFFNPKVGVTYALNTKNKVYASWSVGHREPVRKDFVESTVSSRPSFEQLFDYEFGYKFKNNRFFAAMNGYFMDYNNQLVLTGQINDVGSYTRVNVKKSYRTGVELEAGVKVFSKLNVLGNLTLSQNKIASFTEYLDAYDASFNYSQTAIEHKNTDIAFSPNAIAALIFIYEPVKNLEVTFTTKHVGKQYLDNTSSNDRKINAYTYSNLGVNYSFAKFGMSDIKIGVLVNNIFDKQYVNNGYTWGYANSGVRQDENFYYPQAGRNFLVRLSLNM
jgi:iron complex outermembrane recepter protein